jgi:acyl-coenzyme A thioesterase PaaI-like protein
MTQQGLPLNDDTDYGLCFACGPRNPWGLKLRFETEGDRVTTTFTVSEEYQGFPGYLHGGVAGSILDETMSRVSLLEGRWTMTALMDLRFRFPVPVGSRITVEAVKTGEIRGFLEARGTIYLPGGRAAVKSTGTYAYVPHETLHDMASAYPGLARKWMR